MENKDILKVRKIQKFTHTDLLLKNSWLNLQTNKTIIGKGLEPQRAMKRNRMGEKYGNVIDYTSCEFLKSYLMIKAKIVTSTH